jgi:hypothetical protein
MNLLACAMQDAGVDTFLRRALRALYYAQRRPLLVDLDCSSRLLHASHCLNNSDLGCLHSEEDRVTRASSNTLIRCMSDRESNRAVATKAS